MKAHAGDRIVVPGRNVGNADRQGEVLEVRGANGGPPYVVRWDDGHQGVCFPGAETRVEQQARG